MGKQAKPVLKITYEGNRIRLFWEGDTSKWDARRQMREARKAIRALEAADIALHGKKTLTWNITGMSKDD